VSGVTVGEVRWSFTLDEHVSCLVPSPAGGIAVAGSLAGDVVLIDLDTGAVVRRLPDHPLGVLGAAWSADGSLLATGGQDGRLRIVRADGTEVADHRTGGWVQHLAWSPTGVLAVGAGRSLLIVGDDGELRHRYEPEASTITAVCWSDNDTRVGVTAYGGITWYDVDRLPTATAARRHQYKGSPIALALSPKGRWACAGYQDASIHLWPLWSGSDLQMSGYPAKIEHLAFRHDGRWLASACLGEITVWDFGGRGPAGRRPVAGSAHTSRITWLGWRPGGTVLASGDADGDVVLWPSPSAARSRLAPLQRIGGEAGVATGAWLPGGDALVVGRHDGRVEFRPVG
jgi:WD40 repeat protein